MTGEQERIVRRVREELERLYGNRFIGLIFYGSRVRGDARPDSDYDFLAVLEPVGRRWNELMRLSDLGFDLMQELGVYVSLRPVALGDLASETLFMENVRREGLRV